MDHDPMPVTPTAVPPSTHLPTNTLHTTEELPPAPAPAPAAPGAPPAAALAGVEFRARLPRLSCVAARLYQLASDSDLYLDNVKLRVPQSSLEVSAPAQFLDNIVSLCRRAPDEPDCPDI